MPRSSDLLGCTGIKGKRNTTDRGDFCWHTRKYPILRKRSLQIYLKRSGSLPGYPSITSGNIRGASFLKTDEEFRKCRSSGAHRELRIFLSTGEVSGDLIGANLARALQAAHPGIRLFGVGGERMKQAGVNVFFNTNHLGSVGITEPLTTIPGVLKSFRAIRAHIRSERPNAAILIGHEVFNFLLACRLRADKILTIAYFPPQTWIWGRIAGTISKGYDWILTSFTEEHRIYGEAGGRVIFVGHYLRDLVDEVSPATRQAIRKSIGLSSEGCVVGILPGSRVQEIERLAPILFDTVRQLTNRDPSLQFVLPIADSCIESDIRERVRKQGLNGRIQFTRDSQKTIAACDLVIVCSGTATLEAALMGVPMVILYRVSGLTMQVVKFLVKTRLMDSETAGLPNLLAGKTVVPELRQSQAVASVLVREAWSILTDSEKQNRMKKDLRSLSSGLGEKGATNRTVREILEKVLRST